MTSEPIAAFDAGPGVLDSLSVVIPVYNEETWVRTAVDALVASADAAGVRLDVVIVDDGSTDDTPAVLRELADRTGARVITQSNAGRLEARSRGVAEAREASVLLLDARVIVGLDSLRWIREHVAQHPERRVWCGHVDVETRHNIFAAFWSGLVKVGWRRYTAHPRLVSFGSEDFDYYPKGTGCLLIPRDVLLGAVGGFESLYADAKLASDDTRLLRAVAGEQHIWLSPDFSFRYHGKSGARGFVRQSYFRGTTFVDGYLGQAGAVRRALIAALVGASLLGVVAIRKPKLGAAGLMVAFGTFPAAVRAVGGTRDEVTAVAALAPAFVPIFGAGVLRGLALAAERVIRASPTVPDE
ncbi:putative glycosyltransferase EpsH [mine drainage metagenome]|uniref:Putative glycosyltransferase EpsH n=1 Tax=mine drainage metagenome TaxID=410659 RepID=A0A1J5RB97_9ZZZZ